MLWSIFLGLAPAGADSGDGQAGEAGRVVLPGSAVAHRYDIELRPDAVHLRFSASVRIRVQVLEPTATLTLNAADLTIDRPALNGQGGGQRAAPKVTQDPGRQEASFAFPAVLPPGEYVLSIDYRGRINRQPSGLFALDYDTPKGKRRALYTQFEAGDARRFVPCWDEPSGKAVFALSALVRPGDVAVSNMPATSAQRQTDGLLKVAFAPTPRMSPYLLFFALGDFERVHRKVGRTDLGVIVPRGQAQAGGADFALDAAAQILPEYNDYFGARYPLPKLDLVAAPGGSQATGAMENWGAILFFDQLVLIDPRVSTQRDRQEVFHTIAHELAHQWFGDLVTMAWWDDLWLNEGFATWMEIKIAERLHPEWKSWLRFDSRRRSAIVDDAQDGAQAIVHPVRDVREAFDFPDAITYDKSAAVIRMIEAYAGEDAFRAGVRTYMARHAYGNTVSDDLWLEIEAQSPVPVLDIAHDFTLQPGVPLVDARRENDSAAVSLSQGQFAIDEASLHPAYWRVPVIVSGAGGDLPPLVVGAGASESLPQADGFLLNAGQTGYFVSHYSPALFQALQQRFASLSAPDQLGLIEDAATLAKAGQAPMASFLELAASLTPQADPVVWMALCEELALLEALYPDGPEGDAFRAWIRGTLAPVFAHIGWDAGPAESANTAILRQTLLRALSRADEPAVIDEARRRFERLRADARSLQAEDRSTVIQVVALHADAATWERLRRLARSAGSVLEQAQYFTALGCARDPALAQRALDLALSAEPPRTLALDIVKAVAGQHADMAFSFLTLRWPSILPLLEPDAVGRFPSEIAAQAYDAGTAERLAQFALRSGPTVSALTARRTQAAIRYRASIAQQRLPEIDRWLASGPARARLQPAAGIATFVVVKP